MEKNYCYYRSVKWVLIFLITLLDSIFLYGQTGPGGVGNAAGMDNQPKNILWLDAHQLSESIGTDVSSWEDRSGNANHFGLSSGNYSTTADGSNAGVPKLQNSGFNYLEFTAAEHDRLVRNPFNAFPAHALTTFVMLRTNTGGQGIVSYAVEGEDNEYLLQNATNLSIYIDGGSRNPATNFGTNTWQLLSNRWRSSDGYLTWRQNGTESTNTLKQGATLTNGGSLAIGGEQDRVDDGYATNQDFNGGIAEVIMYDTYLNNAQYIIVENYLGAKYGINLTANDLYTGDNSANGEHDFSVIGIGRQGGSVHQEAYAAGLWLSTYDSSLDADGEFIIAGHNNAANVVSTADLGVGVEARWSRTWYIDRTGSVNTAIAFDFGDGIGGAYPQKKDHYVLLKWNGSTYEDVNVPLANKYTSNDRIVFNVSESLLPNGIYTLGTLNTEESPLTGGPNRTWYSYADKEWSNPDAWTLDGASNPTYVNPGGEIPGGIDNAVITAGKTISVASTQNISINQIEVNGRLDLTTSSGHNFHTIAGSGRILMAGHAGTDNFPQGDASLFADPIVGGTVEIYGGDIILDRLNIFNNLTINLQNSAGIATLLHEYTLHGNLLIENGTLRFGDNSSTISFSLNVHGDVRVEANGSISVGTANARHQFNLYGDLMNNGNLAFTNRTTADYSNEATDGIVDVNFLHDSQDQTLTCNGPSRFYRIEIDKGTDATYKLNMTADDAAYFQLFGPANYRHGEVIQLDDNAPDTGSRNLNALALYRGTIRIGTNINIPVLSNSGNYNISERAQLWVDGGTVTKPSGSAIVTYGTAKVSAGMFEALVPSGFTLRDNGSMIIEGGMLNARQIRTSSIGEGNVGGYIQTGGTANILGGSTNIDYYTFNLSYTGNVFTMSGGTLNIRGANTKGGIFINSDPENTNITGGTINLQINNSLDFIITSRAPFWDLNLENAAGNTYKVTLSEGLDVSSSDIDLAAQPLVVLNDLRIKNATHFKTNHQNVTIGRNFTIENNALYEFENNTTIFNTAKDAVLSIGDITGLSKPATYTDPEGNDVNPFAQWEQPFYNLTVNKPEATLTLATACTYDAGSDNDVHNGSGCKNINGQRNNLIKVANTFALEAGNVDIDIFSIRLYGDIINKGNLSLDAEPVHALVKLKEEQAPATSIIQTIKGASFGNMRLNSNQATIAFTSNVYIQRLEYQHGRIYIGPHNLRIDQIAGSLGAEARFDINGNGTIESGEEKIYSPSDMIITDGKASDGGLTVKVNKNEEYIFPLGIGTDATELLKNNAKYTPATLTVSNFSDDGYITVNPVDAALSTLSDPATCLGYYWRVRHEDFTTVPDAKFQFEYDEIDVQGNENDYRPGRVVDITYEREILGSLAEIDKTNNLINISTATILKPGSYTAAPESAYSGVIHIFYTRDKAREATWTDREAWTRSDLLIDANNDGTINEQDWHDRRQPVVPAGGNGGHEYPQEGDIAVIGWNPWDDADTGKRGLPHGVWISNTAITCAEVWFTRMLDANGEPTERKYRSNFQFRPTLTINAGGVLNTGLVRGEGAFWCRGTDPDFTAMDLGEFVDEDSSYVIYEIFANPVTINNAPAEFPNLMVAPDGWGSNDKNITFATDVATQGNLELVGNINLVLSNGTSGDITVQKKLMMLELAGVESPASGGGAELAFPNAGNGRTVTVYGNIELNNAGGLIHVRNTDSLTVNHTINLYGDYLQNTASATTDGLLLYTAADQDRITLQMKGSESSVFSVISGDVPELYRLVIDKGSSQAQTATFNSDFNLPSGTGHTDGATKSLQLQNGLLILNHAAIDISLTTGGSNFLIPAPAGLEVREGTVRASGDDTGILLDGLLRVSNNGHAYLDGAGNGNNYIEYSASGNAAIEISGNGELIVGSQIRRGLMASVGGVLRYTQTGGVLEVGKNAAPIANRGVFEITNTAGNSFTHTGGRFTVVRQNTNHPEIAALYLSPAFSNVDGSTIIIGNSHTPAGQIIGIDAGIVLNNLEVDNSSNNGPLAQTQIQALHLNGDLIINTGAAFDANGLDLSIDEDFINHGTFEANGNTTIFSGNSTQSISGSGNTSFYNFTKDGSSTLQLAQTILVEKDLRLLQGVFADNGYTVTLKGNLQHDALHTSSGGEGIVFAGTAQQQIIRSGSGSSTLGTITINNSNNVVIPESNGYDFVVNRAVRMVKGVFNIGSSLLTITEDATIDAVNPFSATNMIKTNSSYADKGLKKLFSANTTTDFVFPIGEALFTPATVVLSEAGYSFGSGNGSIRIVPSNEYHPIINDAMENTFPNDLANVLQYYWTIEGSGMNNFKGEIKLKYDDSHVLIADPAYDEADYIPASMLYVNHATGDINKFEAELVDEAVNEITFIFNNISQGQLSGDYFAGVDQAIPNQVATYHSSGTDYGYTDQRSWQETIPPGGPVGSIIIIEEGHTVTLNTDGVNTYHTEIEGILAIGNTVKHRLGVVSGAGTMRVEGPTLPSGQYDAFFSCNGGNLEYAGNTAYTVLADIFTLHNVTLSGTGERRLPATHVNICHDMIVDGPTVTNDHGVNIVVGNDLAITQGTLETGANTTHVVNGNFSINNGTYQGEIGHTTTVSGDVTIDGNFKAGNYNTFNIGGDLNHIAGTFDGGSTNTLIRMNGSAAQIISGTFTGMAAMNRLEISNGQGLSINNDIDIKSELLLTNGLITPTGKLKLSANATATPATGHAGSYVNGMLYKDMEDNSSFTFPVGKGNRWGYVQVQDVNYSSPATLTWRAEYFNENVATLMSSEVSVPAEVSHISSNEYWRIADDAGNTPPATVNAFIGLRWDETSDVAEEGSNRAGLKVMAWNSSTEKWDSYGGRNHTGTASAGSFLALSRLGFSEKIVTIGSGDETNPLPVELINFAADIKEKQVLLSWQTAAEYDNDLFEVQHSADGMLWETIGIVDGAGISHALIDYQFTHENPKEGVHYYRLKQVDYDGKFEYSLIVNVQLTYESAMQFADHLDVKIFPNPTYTGHATLSISGADHRETLLVQMTDMVGKVYLHKTFDAAVLNHGIALDKYIGRLPAGLYIINIHYQHWNQQCKLIVE